MLLSAAPFRVQGAPRLSTQRWLECETGRTGQMRSQEGSVTGQPSANGTVRTSSWAS
jgi:hypothetical protein